MFTKREVLKAIEYCESEEKGCDNCPYVLSGDHECHKNEDIMYYLKEDILTIPLFEELEMRDGWTISNNIIIAAGLKYIGHYNCFTLELRIADGRTIIPYANFTSALGRICMALKDIFEIYTDNDIDFFNALVNTPLRIIQDENKNVVAIGHFMKDMYIRMEDLK